MSTCIFNTWGTFAGNTKVVFLECGKGRISWITAEDVMRTHAEYFTLLLMNQQTLGKSVTAVCKMLVIIPRSLDIHVLGQWSEVSMFGVLGNLYLATWESTINCYSWHPQEVTWHHVGMEEDQWSGSNNKVLAVCWFSFFYLKWGFEDKKNKIHIHKSGPCTVICKLKMVDKELRDRKCMTEGLLWSELMNLRISENITVSLITQDWIKLLPPTPPPTCTFKWPCDHWCILSESYIQQTPR